MKPTAETSPSTTASVRSTRASGKAQVAGGKAFDVARIRRDFPILSTRTPAGKPLIYLDNAATTQKPQVVIDRLDRYYNSGNANIHRGVYALSQNATEEHEKARLKLQKFLNARSEKEIIFTRGTTEGINLVAASYGRSTLNRGDEIILSGMEHHSNIVPWQLVAEQTGAIIRVIPIDDRGQLRMDEYRKLLNDRTKIVAVAHVSNSLGTINPVEEIIRLAHNVGAKVLIDGAQWVAHHATDVQQLDCDFYAFSGHKLFGPTGIGVLYGRESLLETMPPYQGGGDMISTVTFERSTWNNLPHKFEAGTPHIAGAIGLGVAVDYVTEIGLDAIAAYEQELLDYATKQFESISGLRMIGTAERKASVLSFEMVDPPLASLEIGLALDHRGIAIRTGHHCCQPVMDRFGIPGTARASLAMYNTREDVDALVEGLLAIHKTHSAKRSSSTPADESARSAVGADIRYPAPAGTSPKEVAEEVLELFEMLGDAESRVSAVQEMGEKMAPMPDSLKTEENFVKGCMSTVHIAARNRPGSRDVIEFLGDSNTPTVKGLIALVQRLFSGQRAREVLAFDVTAFLNGLGLEQLVTVQRRIGLEKVIERVRSEAAKLVAKESDGSSS